MKKELSPGVIAGIIAVVVIVIGFLGYKLFLGNNVANSKDYIEKSRAQGGPSSGGMVPPSGGMSRPGGMGSGGMAPPSGGMGNSSGMSRPPGQ